MPLAAALRAASGSSLDPQGAANAWAGTSNLDLLAALNVKAGTTGVGYVKTIQTLNNSFALNAEVEYPW